MKKNIVQDIISNHPQVKAFKRKAKDLLKTNTSLTLMQHQNMVAKNNGFNNWHQFLTIIKKDNKPQNIINIESSVLLDDLKSRDYFLAYNLDNKKYIYQNRSCILKHKLIIGDEIFSQYDLFLAKKAIEKKEKVIFINGLNDQNSLQELSNTAQNHQRNLIVFSSEKPIFKDDFRFNLSSLMTLFLYNFNMSNISLKDDYLVHFFHRFFLQALKTINEKNIPLSLSFMNSFLCNEFKIDDLEIDKKHSLMIIKKFQKFIKFLQDSGLFSNDQSGIYLDDFFNLDVIVVQTENPQIQLFFQSLTQALINLIMHGDKTHNQNQITHFFLRDMKLMKNSFAVIPAQMRAFGISLNMSFSNNNFNSLHPDLQYSLWFNTQTKAISRTMFEFIPQETKNLIQEYKGISSSDTFIMMQDNDIFSTKMN